MFSKARLIRPSKQEFEPRHQAMDQLLKHTPLTQFFFLLLLFFQSIKKNAASKHTSIKLLLL